MKKGSSLEKKNQREEWRLLGRGGVVGLSLLCRRGLCQGEVGLGFGEGGADDDVVGPGVVGVYVSTETQEKIHNALGEGLLL